LFVGTVQNFFDDVGTGMSSASAHHTDERAWIPEASPHCQPIYDDSLRFTACYLFLGFPKFNASHNMIRPISPETEMFGEFDRLFAFTTVSFRVDLRFFIE
jgi:hypothetical protein